MTTHQLVFEIGCEDIPARFVEPALADIRTRLEDAFAAARIDTKGIRVFATPRRFAVLIDEVAVSQRDLEEVRTGPPASAAFRDGAPTKAAEGFARGQGVDVSALYTVTTDKGEYVAAKVFEKGGDVATLLPGVLENIVKGTSFPKSMRWADYRETFARPVRWIVAVFGPDVMRFTWAGVTSGRTTYGHRFAAPDPIEVKDIKSYLDGLAGAHVVLDQAERSRRIVAGLKQISEGQSFHVVDDPALLDEVVHLVEEPHVVRVDFGEKYLELPSEVLISSMRSHQRYFAIRDNHDKLVASCAVVYNTPVRDPAVVAAGNLRVLKARLDDARFFWEQDLRVPLETYVDRLESVVWLKQIGTMKERSARLSMTAAHIAERIGASADEVESARRAGYLAKADLVTGLVNEFTDLQGVMGREYARKAGEPSDVAVAIYEQYLPRGAGDELPTTHAGASLALAEKLDALVGCFGIGLVPTSTADPYALRRAALGVIRVIQSRGYSIGLPALVQVAMETYESLDPGKLKVTGDALLNQVLEFIGTRLKHQLAHTYPADVVDAVLAVGLNDVLSVTDRVEALAKLRTEPDFEPLAQGFKRVVNILRKQAVGADVGEVNQAKLVEPAEQALFVAFGAAEGAMQDALSARDWDGACKTLIGLKGPVDGFFDGVMVMADDESLKNNRLALLFGLEKLFKNVADISAIS
ncbi:MAG: glycine--tRNA ligase subunit beta [bacterium]